MTRESTIYLRFALRLLALLALAAGVAGAALYERWGGVDTFYCFGWAVACSMVLALFGYRSLRRGLVSQSPNEAMKHLFGGMLLRFLILVVSHVIVFEIVGSEWGGRALVATTLLYVLALGFEVYSAQQELKLRSRQRPRPESPSGESSELSTEPRAAARGR